MTHRTNHARVGAFTLVEVLVATVIVGLIAVAVAVTISGTFRTRRSAEMRTEAAARAKGAAAMIARDVQNMFRDGDLVQMRLLLRPGASALSKRDELIVLTRAAGLVRPEQEQNESDVHEVHYRVQDDPASVAGEPQGPPGTTLWKRQDPLPDEYIDAGGVAAPVVPGVSGLTVEAFDGEAWTSDWDSDSLGLPLAVRVVVEVMLPDPADPESRRMVASARQVVAIDRTPPLAMFVAAPEATAVGGSTGAGGGGTGTGAGTGTQGGTTPVGIGGAGGTRPGGVRPGGQGGQRPGGPGGPGGGQGGGPGGGQGGQPPGGQPPGGGAIPVNGGPIAPPGGGGGGGPR